jgi:hypothetical protein
MAGKMLPLAQVLGALDRRDKKYYDRLSDEDKKAFVPYIMLRYASNVEGDRFFTEHYVTTTNELVNVNYWQLTKHPKLQWLLFSMVGAYEPQRHPWLKSNSKRAKKSELQTALQTMYPAAKLDELELIESTLTKEQAKKFLDEYRELDKQQR